MRNVPTVCLVGECFNDERLSGKWGDVWNGRLSLKLGAYNRGQSSRFLSGLGIRWTCSANLCPPNKWVEEIASRTARELRELLPDARFILCGAKTCRAFGVPPIWFRWVGPLVAIPHPSVRCRTWTQPVYIGSGERLAKEIIDLSEP